MGFGICKLCRKENELKQSHIIPAFVFKWLKATSATGLIRSGKQPNRRVQDGVKRYWLCDMCEGRFNVWETLFATELFHPMTSGKTNSVQYEDWLIRFCTSLSWRVFTFLEEEEQENLRELSASLLSCARDAAEHWRLFLLGELKTPGPYEQHFLSWCGGARFNSSERMPVNINRFVQRHVGIDFVNWGEHTAFVFSKLGPVMIFGFTSLKNTRHWDGTKVHFRDQIQPRQYALPVQFREYLFSEARRYRRKVLTSLSETQKEKSNSALLGDIERTVNSETLHTLQQDVEFFGEKAFDIEE